MESKNWSEINRSVSMNIASSLSAIDRYKERVGELLTPIKRAADLSGTLEDFDSSVITQSVNRIKESIPELQQSLITANVEALNALKNAVEAFVMSLESPTAISLVLDDNNFRKLFTFLQSQDSNMLDVFYATCKASKVLPLLETLSSRASSLNVARLDFSGLSELLSFMRDKLNSPE